MFSLHTFYFMWCHINILAQEKEQKYHVCGCCAWSDCGRRAIQWTHKRKPTYTLTTLVCKTTSMQKAKLQSTLDTNNLQYRITRNSCGGMNSCERDDRSRGSKSIEKKNVLILGAGNLFVNRGIQSQNCSKELPQDSSNDLQRIAATESAQTNDRWSIMYLGFPGHRKI